MTLILNLIKALLGTPRPSVEPTLPPKTVDWVLSAFHETIEKLNDVADHHDTIVSDTTTQIKVLQAKLTESAAEAKRAMDVALKIAAVVGY